MIKAFKIVNKILLAIAVALLCSSIIVPGITLKSIDMTYLVLVIINTNVVIAAVVGAILSYSNNDIAKRVGHGFIVAAFVLGLATALVTLKTTTTTVGTTTKKGSETSIASVIMIVASIVLALSYVFNLLIYILGKNSNDTLNPSEDVRIVRIKEWKQLMEEGIITQEEYEEKRIQILGIKTKIEKKN